MATKVANDKAKDGWALLEHAPRRITAVRDLELVSFLKCGENFVKGEEAMRRARVELDSNYGQEDAEYLLDHQDEIPTEFRSFHLPFTATVWQDSDGYRFVPCLGLYGKRWCLDFDGLGHDWYSSARLVRPRK